MKSLIISLVLILILPFTSLAADEWDKEDFALISTFITATIIDWGQTRDIVKRYDENYYEKTNIFLGKHPSINQVDTYMPLAIISITTIAHFLSKDLRKKILYGISFLEFGTIYNNHKIGLKINF